MKSQNVSIDSMSHDFLEYNSFVDCTKISSFSKIELLEFIRNNPENVKCNVSEEVLKKVVMIITLSKLISNFDKKRFGFL